MNDQLAEKIWKWCGFTQLPPGKKGFHYEMGVRVSNWVPPGVTEWWQSLSYLPSITLDNLFKWAVPKLLYCDLSFSQTCEVVYRARVGLLYAEAHRKEAESDNPALALALAIEKLIDEGLLTEGL